MIERYLHKFKNKLLSAFCTFTFQIYSYRLFNVCLILTKLRNTIFMVFYTIFRATSFKMFLCLLFFKNSDCFWKASSELVTYYIVISRKDFIRKTLLTNFFEPLYRKSQFCFLFSSYKMSVLYSEVILEHPKWRD